MALSGSDRPALRPIRQHLIRPVLRGSNPAMADALIDWLRRLSIKKKSKTNETCSYVS